MKLFLATKVILLLTINVVTGLFIAGLVLRPDASSFTTAQTTSSYSANWQITKCRYVRSTSNPDATFGSASYVYIGPSEWKVTYTIGTTPLTEKWVASDWNERPAGNGGIVTDGQNMSWIFGDAPATGNKCPQKTVGITGQGPSVTFKDSGYYRYTFTLGGDGYSYPQKWVVTSPFTP